MLALARRAPVPGEFRVDIKLRNIRIYADRIPPSLYGYDEEHAVSDITVDGFFLNDQRITDLEQARFRLGKHARNVTIR